MDTVTDMDTATATDMGMATVMARKQQIPKFRDMRLRSSPARRPPPHPPKNPGAGLIGMGVAGGLVPSPSALIVLLGAIALGRTWFGVALVLAYGAGMAATLTATGLLLVRLADRARPSSIRAASRRR